jgi:hypothetical protein
MSALLSELFNTISTWTERERERSLYFVFFAYANRHIIIDREEKRAAYDAN